MRPARFAFVSPFVLTLAATSLSACSPFAGLEGDWTRGERGHTRWQVADGLCPGFGGGCALDVPLAVGAQVTLMVDGVDGVPLEAEVTGALVAEGTVTTGEDQNAAIPVRAATSGVGRVEISDANGVIDAASLSVRTATRLECGTWSTSAGDLDWRMEGLVSSTELSLPVTRSSSSSSVWLVCRAMDESGPLLSERAISWTVVEGAEVLTLTDDTPFGTATRGARLDYEAPRPGVAIVRATIGEVTQDLTITVE